MQPIKLEIFLDDKTLAGMKSVEGNIAATEAFAKQMIDHLKVQLKELEAQYKVLQGQGLAGDREMADIQAMQGAIGGLKEQLKELQKVKQQTNETPIMSDDPAPKLNSVKMSMAQIARELPAIAMGPQMFFLAISNNIPIFTDAISNARKEYERLTAAGQKATPVWKQVLSSLFSWQTVMATAITLTVVYGKEIGELISKMWKGKKAAVDMADAQEKVNEALDAPSLGKQLVTIRSLQERWNQLGNSLADKKKFITDNKEEFDKLGVSVSNVDEAENALVTNTEAFIQAMTLRAEAAAAFKLASEEAEKALKAQIEIDKKSKEGPSFKDKAISFLFFDSKWTPGSLSNKQKTPREETVWSASIEQQKTIKKTAEEDAETYTKTYNDKLIESAKKLKEAGIKEKTKKDPKGDKHDYTNELADARVRAQQKIEATRIAIMTEGYQKRKAIANQEYKESIDAIDKEERDTLAKLEKSKKSGKKVTPEEVKQVKDDAETQRALARVKYAQDYTAIDVDWMVKANQSWIEYNKQYGTHQQKKLAIAQEYAIKIANAETPYDKEIFKKQRDEAFSSLDFDKLKKSMNWETIFGNLGALTRKQLQDVKQQLTTFRNSPEFKKTATPEQIKIIEEALNNINGTMVDKSGFFGGLGDALTDYEEKVKAVAAAQEELNKALESGDEAAIEKAQENLNQANTNMQGAQGNMDKSTDKAVGNLNKVAAAMKQLGSADVGLAEVGGAVENLVSILGESKSKIGGIIAAILSILDSIGDKGITDFVTDLVGNVLSSLRDAAIKDIDKTSFGLLDMSFFKGADYSDYNEMIDQYTKMNEIWDELIDKKKEYIKTSYGEEAAKAGKEAEDLVRKSMDSYRNLGLERLNAGASTGSHSIGVRQRKSMSNEGWNEAKKVLGNDFNKYEIGDGRMTGLFSLSVEQLEKLKYEAPTFWAKLDGDVSDYLNKIIAGSEKIAEIQEQVKEQLTQVSFDNVRSSFLDVLMDMDSSAEDFADNFAEYMQRAILDSMLAKSYEDRLQAWYDSFAKANSENEGGKTNISDDEYKKLQEEWDKIVSDALGERDALKDLFGWKGEETSSQSGRSGAFETMTQEQGTKLEGLFTALQDHTSAIHKLLEDLTSGRDADKEIFMQIAENTAYCKFLEQMYEIMERQERDGMKLKG